MLAFWADPHHGLRPVDANGTVGLWEGLTRAALPPKRRIVRPLGPAPIIVSSSRGPVLIRAHWGFVPPGVKPEARREVARRSALVKAGDLNRGALREAWTDAKRSWRCLVPATGWLAEVLGVPTACRPEGQPLTLAGVFSRIETADGQVVRTFGLLTGWREDAERFGHQSPLVIDRLNGEAWLSTASDRARALLGNRQPPVIERVVRTR